jgi:hypothetical protein
VQPAIEADFPGRGVVVLDQGAGSACCREEP